MLLNSILLFASKIVLGFTNSNSLEQGGLQTEQCKLGLEFAYVPAGQFSKQ